MLTVTIAVGSLIAVSVVGYYAYKNKEKAADMEAKYNSIKAFADESAEKISKYAKDNLSLANQVIKVESEKIAMSSTIQSLQDRLNNATSAKKPTKAAPKQQSAPRPTGKGNAKGNKPAANK